MMRAAGIAQPIQADPLANDRAIEAARRLETAFQAERSRLLRYLNHLSGRDIAPDLVQEVFVRAATTPRLAEVDHLPSYLNRIARNLAYERTRVWQARGRLAVPFGEQHDPGAPAEQAWRMEARDILRIYRRTVRAMPPKTRRVFLLRRGRHFTYREIGERLGISVPTVEYHMVRAVAACRSAFAAPS